MKRWVQFKLRYHGLENQWADIFLIDTAFRDLLNQYKFGLWRFHRRWANDTIGHQLSFLSYQEDLRDSLANEFYTHKSVRLLEDNNILKSKSIELLGHEIRATSDISWPEDIQNSWPYFIQGVSHMMLELIDQNRSKESKDFKEFLELKDYYEGCEILLKGLFQYYGRHTFIHHIGALFGTNQMTIKI